MIYCCLYHGFTWIYLFTIDLHGFTIDFIMVYYGCKSQLAQVASLVGSSVGTLRVTVRQLTGGRQCLAKWL
jgi:uncharacterized protein YqgC (DUF456 family)